MELIRLYRELGVHLGISTPDEQAFTPKDGPAYVASSFPASAPGMQAAMASARPAAYANLHLTNQVNL